MDLLGDSPGSLFQHIYRKGPEKMVAISECEIVYGEEYILNSRGMKLFTCHWLPVEKDIKGLIFLCHGYGMECSVYTRETGMRLARAGYAVYGIDYEGHGLCAHGIGSKQRKVEK
ncbi:hypothetical protein R1flu_003864 [Riccia fluitans]|uniref:Serine aminopeptidase S33 domain-containing protein n=1 Tax=Riccia fluitans TaxID=41844 RepID=A0ABD1YDU4_9MARC